MSKNAASEIKFRDLCKLLNDIRSKHKQSPKEELLQQFYKEYRKKGEVIRKNNPTADVSLYPILRLLLPQLERERPAYGLNKFGLKKVIAKLVGLTKDSDILKPLSSHEYDFAESASTILQKYLPKNNGEINILEVNAHLDMIAKKHEDNQVSHQENAFRKLFQLISPDEQKWIIKIILKKVNLGIPETKILNLFHPQASILLNNTSNLLTVCAILNDPNVEIGDSEVTLFTPVRPMLLSRSDAKEFLRSVTEDKEFIFETKFDGERFQIHMEDDRFKYFSRRGFDFTKQFGESYATGLYTPFLKNLFKDDVKSFILDGEMMGWNRETKQFGSKGMAFDVKHLTENSLHQPCFVVFDMLLLNGVLITRKPLQQRLKMLKEIFTAKAGVLMLSKQEKVNTRQKIIDALNESADKDEEGVVYKDLDSMYVPNNRRSGWWKLKLEYFSGMMTDLDVIIMGCFFGTGGKVNSVIVGVSVTTDTDSAPKNYISLGQIGSGLTIKEWESVSKQLSPYWVKTDGNNYELSGLRFGKMKPTVWIPPEKSVILLIRASELTKSHGSNPDFKAAYTLRFPRIESIRLDKPYYDCLSLSELSDLVSSSSKPVEKLFRKRISLEDMQYEVKKTKKHRAKFTDTNVEIQDQITDILKNHEFYVLAGTAEWKVAEVEKTIKENGGKIVKAETDNTYCILVGDWHKRLDYYKGSVDVVKLNWLQKVLDCQKLYAYEPEDVIYTTTKTKYRFMRNYDKYGDSYTEKTTRYTLEKVFNNIKKMNDYLCPLSEEIAEFHKEIKYDKQLNIFHSCIAYFDKYEIVNDTNSQVIYDSSFDELVLKFWGGQITKVITNANTIITQSEESGRNEQLQGHIPNNAVMVMNKSFIYEEISKYINEINL